MCEINLSLILKPISKNVLKLKGSKVSPSESLKVGYEEREKTHGSIVGKTDQFLIMRRWSNVQRHDGQSSVVSWTGQRSKEGNRHKAKVLS